MAPDEAIARADQSSDTGNAIAERDRAKTITPRRATHNVVTVAQGRHCAVIRRTVAPHAGISSASDKAVGGADDSAYAGGTATKGHHARICVPRSTEHHIVAIRQLSDAAIIAEVADIVVSGATNQAVGCAHDAANTGSAAAKGHGS